MEQRIIEESMHEYAKSKEVIFAPCPECGAKFEHFKITARWISIDHIVVYVYCTKCERWKHFCYMSKMIDIQQIIDDWNRYIKFKEILEAERRRHDI